VSFAVTDLSARSADGSTFHGISFDVPPGEGVAITSIGPADFLSLLEVLAGLAQPLSGEVRWRQFPGLDPLYDESASVARRYWALRMLREKTGFVSDTVSLINNISIFDNIALPLRYHKSLDEEDADERVDRILHLLEIAEVADDRPAQLPLEVRRRAAIGRALVLDPVVVFLDSPLANLDGRSCEIILTALRVYSEKAGMSIVAMSYDVRPLLSVVSSVVVLHDGKPIEALTKDRLEEGRFPAELERLRRAHSAGAHEERSIEDLAQDPAAARALESRSSNRGASN
jgi:ABC-type sulfate/molybdate transport systems ATPase subunit